MSSNSKDNLTRQDEHDAAGMGRAFCRFLQRIHPGIADTVLAAALLASRAYQTGDVCMLLQEYAGARFWGEHIDSEPIDLPDVEAWKSQLRACPAVGYPGDYKPLILDHSSRLYFQKLWLYERNLAAEILKKVNQEAVMSDCGLLKTELDLVFDEQQEGNPNWQKVAAVLALLNKFTVISGGPGTGKTTTVVKLLVLMTLLRQKTGAQENVALAAPTGKAAARMEQSIRETIATLDIPAEIKKEIPAEAATLHRLLGARRHRPQFKYDSDNPLPYDTVIVDEASMVDQAMMSKLLEAMLDEASLVLLGDKDQLASVEAGSVLGDLCEEISENRISPAMAERLRELSVAIPKRYIAAETLPLTDHIILLKKNYRFGESSGIARLTACINEGEAQSALHILQDQSLPRAQLTEVRTTEEYQRILTERMIGCFSEMGKATGIRDAFSIFNRYRILAAHRSGPWGVEYINRLIEQALEQEGMKSPYNSWYDEKPVIINKNNHSMGLSNGDVGICRRDKNGRAFVYFSDANELIRFRPSRLPDCSTAFALTIHKSQGSEFEDVLLVLPDQLTKVVSRELLYTGVSRARGSVRIIAKKNVLMQAIHNKTARNSGLSDYLWKKKDNDTG